MELQSIFFGAFLELIILQTVKPDIPGCHFLETVDISSSQRLNNGSYLYQDLVEIPVNLTGEYDYITTALGVNDTVRSHLRGCVCRLRPCIWICCRYKDMQPNGVCTDGLMEINPFLNVTLSNGSVVKRNLLKDYIVLRDRMRMDDTWFEINNTFYESEETRTYDCHHPNQFSAGNTKSFMVAIHTSSYHNKSPAPQLGQNELKLLSEVFLVLSIAVYMYIRKLRNVHGKCFICYMITTLIYSFHQRLQSVQIPLQYCVPHCYSFIFFLMAKFTWLSAMSHQLWRGFTSVNRSESEYSFLSYSSFTWGSVTILMGVFILIDRIWDGDPNKINWILCVGWEGCDIFVSNFLTLFCLLPLSTLIILNTSLFILTTINIIKTNLSLKYFSDQDERKRRFNSRMLTYKVFLRLFVVMDMQWSVRLITVYTDWDFLLMICNYCDSCIGIIIFVLFILKRSTIRLIMESIRNEENNR